MKQVTIWLWLTLIFLAACSAEPEPTPTPQSPIVMRDEGTSTPTLTPTPTFTPSSTPTITLTPTPTSTSVPSPTFTPSPTPDAGPETILVGTSYLGKTIEAVRFGFGSNKIIFIGGIHEGFTPASSRIAERSITYFTENLQNIPSQVTIYVIKSANPDSASGSIGLLSGRLNGNGVDLNRNWSCRWQPNPIWAGAPTNGVGGTMPLSEPETQSISEFFETVNPAAVVIWLARVPEGLVSAGGCGARPEVSEDLAIIYGSASGYRVDSYEEEFERVSGDVTNDLDAQGIPAIAVILSDYNDDDWSMNLRGILAVIQSFAE